jgi:GDP-L-fucose synthase
MQQVTHTKCGLRAIAMASGSQRSQPERFVTGNGVTSHSQFAGCYRGKRVLVTGGAGFAGSHLVEALVSLDAEVTVPRRPSTRLEYLDAVVDRVRIMDADLAEPRGACAAVANQEIVFHLAAAKGGGIVHSMQHHGSLFRDNMLTTIHVLEALRRAQPQRVVFTSSACVYPRHCSIPTPEEDGARDAPEPTNAGYGWSKRMLEFLAGAYREEFGINVGIARPFNLYGPRDDFFAPSSHVIPGIIRRLYNGENPLVVWGSGQQTRSFLYVEDLARGLLLMGAHRDYAGPVNFAAPEEVTIHDLAALIVELSGKDVALRVDPSRPDGQPRRAGDGRRARRELGFEAVVPLREGLRHTLRWYEKNRSKGELV